MNCAVCSAPAKQQCSACASVYYCSQAHQKEDWKQHKLPCRLASVCRRAPPTSRNPFDFDRDLEEEDAGKAVSYIMVIEHIRNGGNGVVPSTFQAHPQFLDSCLSAFDKVKPLLVKMRKENSALDASGSGGGDVVQKELNECLNHFRIRYLLDRATLDAFTRIQEVNTFSSTERMDSVVPEDFLHHLLVQVCKQEFGSKSTPVPVANIKFEGKWTYPWPIERDADWSHAILARYGEVTLLDRRLQANLLESAVFPRATRYALTQDEYVLAMRRRMGAL